MGRPFSDLHALLDRVAVVLVLVVAWLPSLFSHGVGLVVDLVKLSINWPSGATPSSKTLSNTTLSVTIHCSVAPLLPGALVLMAFVTFFLSFLDILAGIDRPPRLSRALRNFFGSCEDRS
jgi:hypothetical protein